MDPGTSELVDIAVRVADGALSISHESQCCKWHGGRGNVTADGHTILVDATGPGHFLTSQRGYVSRDVSGKADRIMWNNVGGERRKWADWTKPVKPDRRG